MRFVVNLAGREYAGLFEALHAGQPISEVPEAIHPHFAVVVEADDSRAAVRHALAKIGPERAARLVAFSVNSVTQMMHHPLRTPEAAPYHADAAGP